MEHDINRFALLFLMVVLAVAGCDVTESLPEEESEEPEEELLEPNLVEEYEGEIEWTEFGLDEEEVHSLSVFERNLFALTEEDLLRRKVDQPDSAWESVGFETDTIRVMDIAFLDEDQWIIRVHYHNIDYNEVDYEEFPLLYRTNNGGIDWDPEPSSNINNTLRIGGLVQDGKKPETLWAISGRLIRSDDFGKSWYNVDSAPLMVSGHSMATSPYHQGVIWTQSTPITQGVREHLSLDDGETWERIGTPSLTYRFLFNPADIESNLITTHRYIMFKSIDRTQSWSELISPIVDGVDIYSVANSIIESEKVYAGGRLGTGENIEDQYEVFFNEERESRSSFLLISDDWGESWGIDFNREITDANVRQIVVAEVGGEDLLFLRTSKGIYRARIME